MSNRSRSGRKSLPPVERNAAGQFRPGCSGNPSGRPKKTPEEETAVRMMKAATPEAVDIILKIIRDEKSSCYAKLQAAEMILNRAMGRPDNYLKVENVEESVEEAAASLLELFENAAKEDAVHGG